MTPAQGVFVAEAPEELTGIPLSQIDPQAGCASSMPVQLLGRFLGNSLPGIELTQVLPKASAFLPFLLAGCLSVCN